MLECINKAGVKTKSLPRLGREMCIAPGKERKGSEEKEGGQGSSQA